MSDHRATEIQSTAIGDSLTVEGKQYHSHHPEGVPPQSAPEADQSSPPEESPKHGCLQRTPTTQEEGEQALQAERTITGDAAGPVYSVFSKNQKRFIVFMASWAGFFSPVSGQIYFPALNPLAKDLRVSDSLINLTLTSYMVRPGA